MPSGARRADIVAARLGRATPQRDRAEQDGSDGERRDDEELATNIGSIFRVVRHRVQGIDRVRQRTLVGLLTLDKPLVGFGRPLAGVPSVEIDEVAIAPLAARDLGLSVRQDLSIIGIDDYELAEFFQLTTVAQFPMGQGKLAAEILIAQLEPSRREEPASRVTLPFELIVRSSTARPHD